MLPPMTAFAPYHLSALVLALLLPAVASATDGGGLVIQALPVEPMAEVIAAQPQPSAAPLAPTPVLAAPRRAGLPEPSIIVGDLAVLMTTAERGPLGTPRPAREAIRQRDPAIFERLLSQGAFDPQGDQLAAALQTELAQMNCYAGGIDGDWGGGSIAALGRYFQTLGAAQAASQPDMGLFRAIARSEAVRCAPVQTAAPAATPSATRRSGGGGGGTTRATGAAPARTQPQPPAPAAAGTGSRQINPGMIGSGMFR